VVTLHELDEYLETPLSSIITLDDVVASVRDIDASSVGITETLEAGFFVHGTGTLGYEIAHACSAAGLPLRGFTDSNAEKWGRDFCGYPVAAPDAVAGPVVVAVFHAAEPLAALRALDRYPVFSYYHLFLAYPRVFLPYWCLDATTDTGARVGARMVREAHARIDDETSRIEFARQWASRFFLGVLDSTTAHESTATEYFSGTMAAVRPGEVLVDVGAFDGDTARRFLGRSESGDTSVVAIEPDRGNFEKLRLLERESHGRVTSVCAIVSDKPGVLAFEETASAASRVLASANAIVPAIRLDDVWSVRPFSRVKTDVEGHEDAVLRGARAVIDAGTTNWSMAAYHRPLDLVSFQTYFGEGYRMEVSAHAPRPWDSTVYFIRR
jgi:FkbM family methyltransferase